MGLSEILSDWHSAKAVVYSSGDEMSALQVPRGGGAEERRQTPEDSLRHVSVACSLWLAGAPPRIHPHSTTHEPASTYSTHLGILPAWNKISRHVLFRCLFAL